jgi:predicted ferric reductase
VIRLRWSTAIWLVLYVLVVTAPLIGGVFNLGHGRGFWLNFSIALGFVSLSMFGAQFVLVSRVRAVCEPVGMDGVLHIHRLMAYVATVFALVHPTILFFKDEKYLALLIVLNAPLRAKFAVAAVGYRLWRLTHWLLAVTIVVTSLVHAILVNYYLQDPLEQLVWLGLTALFVTMGVWVRVIQPLLRYRRRWRVQAIQTHPGDITTLELELVNPKSYGSGGFRFRAGQFAWICARRSPFALTDNPFSLCCSAERHDRVRFTIKAHQGFSAEVAKLQTGEIVYLDGPHGTFTLQEDDGSPMVFIGAGVGVTPLIAMLHTLADRGCTRACTLWLGNLDEDHIVCASDIAELQTRLQLTVVHALSQAKRPEPSTERRINPAFIERHWPNDGNAAQFYLCGPNPQMDMAEACLMARGVPRHRVHSERFSMA